MLLVATTSAEAFEPSGGVSLAPPDCLIVPNTACHQKCLDNYHNAAVECAKLKEEAQRKACDANAFATYTSCRASCQTAENECYDKCDAIADKDREKCKAMPPGSPEQAKCNQAVEEQRAACYRECNKKK